MNEGDNLQFAPYVKGKPVFILCWRQRKVCSKWIQFNGKFWIQWSCLRGRCTIYCVDFNGICAILYLIFSFSDLLTWFSFNSYCMSLIQGSWEREPHSGRMKNLKRKCATQQALFWLWPLQKLRVENYSLCRTFLKKFFFFFTQLCSALVSAPLFEGQWQKKRGAPAWRKTLD